MTREEKENAVVKNKTRTNEYRHKRRIKKEGSCEAAVKGDRHSILELRQRKE